MSGQREYPFQWVDIPQEEVESILRKPKREYVRSIPGDVWMPKKFGAIAEKIYNFQVRPDDIWIVTYPKCGTTWTQELVWQVAHNVDLEGAKATPQWVRSPYLEFEVICPDHAREMMQSKAPEWNQAAVKAVTSASLDLADNSPSPRIIKSHTPLSMLPPELFTKGCKVVYVCRNPKDVCVSYFHHTGLWQEEYREDYDHFEKMFLDGTFMHGSYWYHLKDAWQYRDNPNLKIVWYEEMKGNLPKIIREMSDFLGYPLTEEKVGDLTEHLHIDNQRKHGAESMSNGIKEMNQMMTKFFRKGEVGDWKNYIVEEKALKWEEWIESNVTGTEIEIAYELKDR